MNPRLRFVILALTLLWTLDFGPWTSDAQAADTSALISSWLNAATNMQTWSADFTQTRTLKSLSQPLTATGHIWFSAPNRFHWEIQKPSPTIAVRGANEMLIIYPKLKRAERYSLNGEQAGPWRDIMKLLDAGFPRSQAEMDSQYNLLKQQVTDDICELTLQPKSLSARKLMPQLKIAFSTKEFTLRSTELQLADGSTMRNDFSNGQLNVKVDAALFAPKLDSDYKISEPFSQK